MTTPTQFPIRLLAREAHAFSGPPTDKGALSGETRLLPMGTEVAVVRSLDWDTRFGARWLVQTVELLPTADGTPILYWSYIGTEDLQRLSTVSTVSTSSTSSP